jgi:hypothetical protein
MSHIQWLRKATNALEDRRCHSQYFNRKPLGALTLTLEWSNKVMQLWPFQS